MSRFYVSWEVQHGGYIEAKDIDDAYALIHETSYSEVTPDLASSHGGTVIKIGEPNIMVCGNKISEALSEDAKDEKST